MRLPSLFKSPSHQRFDYKPRFWDEKKEELEKRIQEAEARRDGDVDAVKSSISKTFKRGGVSRNYMADRNYRVQQTRRSNMRLVLIIMVLLLAFYLLMR